MEPMLNPALAKIYQRANQMLCIGVGLPACGTLPNAVASDHVYMGKLEVSQRVNERKVISSLTTIKPDLNHNKGVKPKAKTIKTGQNFRMKTRQWLITVTCRFRTEYL